MRCLLTTILTLISIIDFQEAGYTTKSQLTTAVLSIAGVQVLFTLVTSFIIDKAGRKAVYTTSIETKTKSIGHTMQQIDDTAVI